METKIRSSSLILVITLIVVVSDGVRLFSQDQDSHSNSATPEPQGIPKPAAVSDAPYVPQTILPGGIVIPLYPSGSPALNDARVREAEIYSLSKSAPGRVSSIINIHNPSIEVHTVESSLNTGATVILAAGGGHNTLNVGTEGSDFVPYFYNYGVNTVILRNRLRKDGYDVKNDAVKDALQAIKIVRANSKAWNLDPHRIGMMGFSAGAELAAPAALHYEEFDRTNQITGENLGQISSRPDFVALIYPGPTPFARGGKPVIPKDVPPCFVVSAGSGDRIHAVWATEYFAAMLALGVPNIEMHIYGNGRHPGDPLPDGTRMSGGLADRRGIPFGTWQDRFIDWFRDLGFLSASGVQTKADRDTADFVARPPREMSNRPLSLSTNPPVSSGPLLKAKEKP